MNQNNFVKALNLISHTAENSNIKNALHYKRRARLSWKFAKKDIFLVPLTSSDIGSLAGLLNFDFRIL